MLPSTGAHAHLPTESDPAMRCQQRSDTRRVDVGEIWGGTSSVSCRGCLFFFLRLIPRQSAKHSSAVQNPRGISKFLRCGGSAVVLWLVLEAEQDAKALFGGFLENATRAAPPARWKNALKNNVPTESVAYGAHAVHRRTRWSISVL